MAVGGPGTEGSATTARDVGGTIRERKRMVVSMGQDFGEESIIEVPKGILGGVESTCMRLIAWERCGGCGGVKDDKGSARLASCLLYPTRRGCGTAESLFLFVCLA